MPFVHIDGFGNFIVREVRMLIFTNVFANIVKFGNMQLRTYKISDCSALYELFLDTVHSVNSKDYSKVQLDAWAPLDSLTPREEILDIWNKAFLLHHTVVAVENDLIVGFGDISKYGYLDRLFVHKSYQRQGIATAICNDLENFVTGKNISTQASITAKPFFLKRGYKLVNEQTVIRQGVLLKNYLMEK